MQSIINLLEKILKELNRPERSKLIQKFQNLVWLDERFDEKDSKVEILDELAYDFEFYEEDPEKYGEERFKKEIQVAIEKIKKV